MHRSVLYLCISSEIFVISMYLSFVMCLPEDGHMNGQNMYEVNVVYNVLAYVMYTCWLWNRIQLLSTDFISFTKSVGCLSLNKQCKIRHSLCSVKLRLHTHRAIKLLSLFFIILHILARGTKPRRHWGNDRNPCRWISTMSVTVLSWDNLCSTCNWTSCHIAAKQVSGVFFLIRNEITVFNSL
jgi:hypothetical protein